MSDAHQATAVSTPPGFADSPAVVETIDALVRQLADAQAAITGERPPSPTLVARNDSYLARQGAVKGRPPLYPYVGSGLGRGSLVELADGSVKWDLINGIGVHMFGHNDPDLVRAALRAVLSDTVMQGNLQFNVEAIEFAELLVSQAQPASDLKYCFLINSGAMANESALKVCLQARSPADRVLAFEGGSAGRTTAMLQIGSSPEHRVGLPVDYVPFYDTERGAESTEAASERLEDYVQRHPGRHACFVMELVQGEGGFRVAPREFFVPLMERCRKHGIAVWVDEIQTFGRTLEMFHFEQLSLGEYVDVLTLGKLSQVCACLYTEAYKPKPGLLSATFVGSTVALQVGLRMLQRLRDGGYYGPDGRIAALFEAFCERARALVEAHPKWFTPLVATPQPNMGGSAYGGVGGMMRISPLRGQKASVQKALRMLFDEGVIAFYCGQGPYHIRFLPPVGVMEPQQFDDVFEIVERALKKVMSD